MNSYLELESQADYRQATLRAEADRERLAQEAKRGRSPALQVRLADRSDRAELCAFLMRLSPATLHARYLNAWPRLPRAAAEREVRRLLDGDADSNVVVVAEDGLNIRGVGEFVAGTDTATAELAMVVEDAFQDRGIGRMLYQRLEQLARERRVKMFTGDVHYENRRVLELMRRSRRATCLEPGLANIRFTMRLEAGPDLRPAA